MGVPPKTWRLCNGCRHLFPSVAFALCLELAIGAREAANVLKYLIASATILPFATKRSVANAQVVQDDQTVDLAPITPPIVPPISEPISIDQASIVTPLQAVHLFVVRMQQLVGHDRLRWADIRSAYDDLAEQNAWPELSDKTLGTLLGKCGCKRTEVDLRKRGEGRTKAYLFPREKRKRKK